MPALTLMPAPHITTMRLTRPLCSKLEGQKGEEQHTLLTSTWACMQCHCSTVVRATRSGVVSAQRSVPADEVSYTFQVK